MAEILSKCSAKKHFGVCEIKTFFEQLKKKHLINNKNFQLNLFFQKRA